jgi:hypothetical protein
VQGVAGNRCHLSESPAGYEICFVKGIKIGKRRTKLGKPVGDCLLASELINFNSKMIMLPDYMMTKQIGGYFVSSRFNPILYGI